MEILIVFLAGLLLYHMVNGKRQDVDAEIDQRYRRGVENRDVREYGGGCLQSLLVGLPLSILAMLICIGTLLLIGLSSGT